MVDVVSEDDMNRKEFIIRKGIIVAGAIGIALGWMPSIAEFIVHKWWVKVPSWWTPLWLSWCGGLLVIALLCSIIMKHHERVAWGLLLASLSGLIAPRIF